MTYKRVRRARAGTAVIDAYTGPVGEIVIDTDLLEIRLQNGSPGGLRVPRFGGAASFSTLAASGAVTLSGGTANGVAYLNGSKVLTTGSALTFDGTLFRASNTGAGFAAVSRFERSNGGGTHYLDVTVNPDTSTVKLSSTGSANGNLILGTNALDTLYLNNAGNAGLGVTPSASWGTNERVFDIAGASQGHVVAQVNSLNFGMNYLINSGGAAVYQNTGFASRIQNNFTTGNINFFTAPSGTANSPISFSQAMTLTQGGNLLVGTTSDNGEKLQISGVPSGAANSIARIQGTTSSKLLLIDNVNNAAIGTNGAGAMLFYTNDANTEAARITSARYFKASNTGTYVNAAGSFHEFNGTDNSETFFVNNNVSASTAIIVHTRGAANFAGFHFLAENTGTTVYQVLANGNVQNANNSFGAISDLKHKESITDAPSYLDRFMQVRFRNFNFIGSDLKQFGVIAQELEPIFPGLVDETPDTVEVTKTRIVEVPAVLDEEGNEVTPATTREEEYTEREPNGEVTKSVKYSILAQIQGKVIQEMYAKNQEQQAIIQSQQAQIDAILERLTALESK